MKVTKLSAQERNVERVNMFLDEKFACGISLNTVAKYNIFVGKELSGEEYTKILYDDLGERLFNRAVDYLGSSIKTAKQIRTYLRNLLFKKKGSWYEELEKENREELVENTMQKLEEYSYLNDVNLQKLSLVQGSRTNQEGRMSFLVNFLLRVFLRRLLRRN